MANCTGCGAPLENGVQYCNYCGARQNPQGICRYHFRFAIVALCWDLLIPVVWLIMFIVSAVTHLVPYSERKGLIAFIGITLPGMVFIGTMILGLVVKIASVVISIRAKKLQFPKAGTSVIVSVVALVLSVVGYALFYVMVTFLSRF